jgi:hypothetical protein
MFLANLFGVHFYTQNSSSLLIKLKNNIKLLFSKI